MAYTTHPCSGLPRRRSYATSRKLPQDAVRCCVPTRRSRTVARNWILVQPREVSSSHFVHLHINDDRSEPLMNATSDFHLFSSYNRWYPSHAVRRRRAKHIAGVLDAKLGSEVRVSVLHRGLFLGEVISISGMPSVTTAGGALGGNPRRNSTGTGPVSDSLHTRGEANEGAAPGTAAAEGLAIRISERSERQPAAPRIDLLLAMPRPKVLSRLWAPLCTLGVRQVRIELTCCLVDLCVLALGGQLEAHSLSALHFLSW